MKVKVRRIHVRPAALMGADMLLRSEVGKSALLSVWPETISQMPTEELEAILCYDFCSKKEELNAAVIRPVMVELARRRHQENLGEKTAEQAWSDFKIHYMPKKPTSE